jgi:hypothetical protein
MLSVHLLVGGDSERRLGADDFVPDQRHFVISLPTAGASPCLTFV